MITREEYTKFIIAILQCQDDRRARYTLPVDSLLKGGDLETDINKWKVKSPIINYTEYLDIEGVTTKAVNNVIPLVLDVYDSWPIDNPQTDPGYRFVLGAIDFIREDSLVPVYFDGQLIGIYQGSNDRPFNWSFRWNNSESVWPDKSTKGIQSLKGKINRRFNKAINASPVGAELINLEKEAKSFLISFQEKGLIVKNKNDRWPRKELIDPVNQVLLSDYYMFAPDRFGSVEILKQSHARLKAIASAIASNPAIVDLAKLNPIFELYV